jgi:hypothetical protein
LNCCRRLENNFHQGSAKREAVFVNGTDRFGDFNETKATAFRETVVHQMPCMRWTFEIEIRERRAFVETRGTENCDLSSDTNGLGRTQISNKFAIVSPNQTIFSNKIVDTVDNKREGMRPQIPTVALDEFD